MSPRGSRAVTHKGWIGRWFFAWTFPNWDFYCCRPHIVSGIVFWESWIGYLCVTKGPKND